MPRYVVERTFPDGLIIPMDETGEQMCRSVVSYNAQEQVTGSIPMSVRTSRKPIASTMGPPQKRSGKPHGAITFRSIALRRFASSIRTSIPKAGTFLTGQGS